jgi:hypothetical protein
MKYLCQVIHHRPAPSSGRFGGLGSSQFPVPPARHPPGNYPASQARRELTSGIDAPRVRLLRQPWSLRTRPRGVPRHTPPLSFNRTPPKPAVKSPQIRRLPRQKTNKRARPRNRDFPLNSTNPPSRSSHSAPVKSALRPRQLGTRLDGSRFAVHPCHDLASSYPHW